VNALAKRVHKHDSHVKSVFGATWNTICYNGRVLSTTLKKNVGAQRGSTYVTVRFMLENGVEKVRELCISVFERAGFLELGANSARCRRLHCLQLMSSPKMLLLLTNLLHKQMNRHRKRIRLQPPTICLRLQLTAILLLCLLAYLSRRCRPCPFLFPKQRELSAEYLLELSQLQQFSKRRCGCTRERGSASPLIHC
jgi:hypothetical protein